MNASMRYWGIVPAAGSGSRMQQKIPKQYLPLLASTVLDTTLQRLKSLDLFEKILVPLSPEDTRWNESISSADNLFLTVVGGSKRSYSVVAAIEALTGVADEQDWVLVHDSARPCFPTGDIRSMISLLSEHPVGGLMAVPISDTVKQVNDGAVVSGTLNRKALWRAQTPQMFRYGLLKKALEQAHEERFDMTDEASAIELFGLKPAVVKGSEANIKITFPEDLLLAEFYLEKLSGE